MKKTVIFLTFLSFMLAVSAQNVGVGTTSPLASAQLDVTSTTKGFLPPRMTTVQRDLVASPAVGLVIFNITANSLQLYTSTGWTSLTTASAVFMPTIVIGTQQWMSENLDIAFYRNGDPIPQVSDATAWANLTTGAWCYYNNDSTKGGTYGKLYNWYAVNDARGLAPSGWHIPSDAEWTTLETTFGGIPGKASGKMKEAGILHWLTPNNEGNNNSGWAALPGGFRYTSAAFSDLTLSGYWWTASLNGTNVWYRNLVYYDGYVYRSSESKVNGFAVRCVRD